MKWSMVLSLFLSPAAALAAEPGARGYEGQTQKVIENALKQYSSAKSYQDKLTISGEVDAEGPEKLGPPEPMEMTLTFAQPNKIALKTPGYRVVSDGKKMWQYFGQLEQYLESPAPAQVELGTLELHKYPQVYEQFKHPIALTITVSKPSVSHLLGNVTEFTGTKAESRKGEAGWLVSGVLEMRQGQNQVIRTPFKAWFSEKTGLLREMVYDHTKRAQEAFTGLKVNKYLQVARYEDAKLNEAVSDERFTFKPGSYDKKVAEFELPSEEEYQRKLIGRTAPDFATKDLFGKTLKLAEFKGRVVVLDFWATWCRPCVMSMPHVQKLSEKYAKQPVAVLGVNGDRPGTEQEVIKFLQKNKFTYPQLTDFDNKIAEAYRVSTIPFVVLIDKQGIVQALYSGYSDEQMDEIAAGINKVLKGENLFKPQHGSTSSEPASGSGSK